MANQTIKIGPWGAAGGEPWDFTPGSGSAITGIVIAHGTVVDSISFRSISHANGVTTSSPTYGGSGGSVTDTINLETGEYLMSISGIVTGSAAFYPNVVGSLTFRTNKTTYGPYGKATGSTFDIPIENGQIVGFFGHADNYITAIGIYVIPSYGGSGGFCNKAIKIGPWGAAGGEPWDFTPGSHSAITGIVIAHGTVVDSISFKSITHANGVTTSSPTYGGSGGSVTDTINLETGEYLMSISGIVTGSAAFYPNVVGSLTFRTNKTTYGPYGKATGSTFDIPIDNGQIIGFFGHADNYITAIGIYVIPSYGGSGGFCNKAIKIGPWGAAGGEPWDFTPGSDSAITGIVIAHGTVVDSISFKSITHANGVTTYSPTYGGSGGSVTDTINLETGEYLMSISGIVTGSAAFYPNVVGSLTFRTNKTTYGPYGKAIGSTFDSTIENGQIIGFFGHADNYITAIGIYVIPSAT